MGWSGGSTDRKSAGEGECGIKGTWLGDPPGGRQEAVGLGVAWAAGGVWRDSLFLFIIPSIHTPAVLCPVCSVASLTCSSSSFLTSLHTSCLSGSQLCPQSHTHA